MIIKGTRKILNISDKQVENIIKAKASEYLKLLILNNQNDPTIQAWGKKFEPNQPYPAYMKVLAILLNVVNNSRLFVLNNQYMVEIDELSDHNIEMNIKNVPAKINDSMLYRLMKYGNLSTKKTNLLESAFKFAFSQI